MKAVRGEGDSGGAPNTSDVFAAPTNFSVCQVGYGEVSLLRLTWSNSENYESIAAFVDGEAVPVEIDGAHGSAFVEAAPGDRAVEIEGLVGEFSSLPAEAMFSVLAESPVPNPVSEIECEYVPGAGGTLAIDWTRTAANDAWVSGEVRMGGRRGNVEFGDQDSFDVALLGDRPDDAVVAFKNADGYFSEPIAVPCLQQIPAFLRGDCDQKRARQYHGRDLQGEPSVPRATSLVFATMPATRTTTERSVSRTRSTRSTSFSSSVRRRRRPGVPRTATIDPSDDFLGGICVQRTCAP